MFNHKTIAENIYYVGVNDRQKTLFENYIPIPCGVSYNSYLIMDEKITLVDTVDASMVNTYMDKIRSIIGSKDIDYLIINHMEPDHAGSIGLIAETYPHMTLIGNKKTFSMLDGYFHTTNPRITVNEGESINTGKYTISFYMAPMVHWPEVMVSYIPEIQLLFSADAFGTFGTLDGAFMDTQLCTQKYWDEMRRYYACIVGKFGKPVQMALQKLSGLSIHTVCPTHGPIWQRDLAHTISLYDTWSRYQAEENGVCITYATMYGNTQLLAEAFAEGVIDGGINKISIHNASLSNASYILADVFKYKGFAIGGPTYMNECYPMIENIISQISHRGIPDRLFACFGSKTWAGGTLKHMTHMAETLQWQQVAAPVDNLQGVKEDDYKAAYEAGKSMGLALKALE